MKTSSCNENKPFAFESAPRCGARTKRNSGAPCNAPAVRGKKRCRIHGGAKGSGAQQGNINAMKHGETTAKLKKFRRAVKQAIRENRILSTKLE